MGMIYVLSTLAERGTEWFGTPFATQYSFGSGENSITVVMERDDILPEDVMREIERQLGCTVALQCIHDGKLEIWLQWES